MSRIGIFFLLVITPALAVLLALLGAATLRANPLGWFLLLIGVVYAAGMVITAYMRRGSFWESQLEGNTSQEERGDRSFWLISLAMMAVFYLSPLEYLYFTALLPRTVWMESGGVGLLVSGIALFVWARRTLGASYSGHISVKHGQELVQSGPYHFIRHPAYAGYLLIALGINLGYASLTGLAAVAMILFPVLIYRINVEEKLLAKHFGETYRDYSSKTKRLIPNIW
jgi:protein-S-isoprenylcysteine O-methyltransferase Ste14